MTAPDVNSLYVLKPDSYVDAKKVTVEPDIAENVTGLSPCRIYIGRVPGDYFPLRISVGPRACDRGFIWSWTNVPFVRGDVVEGLADSGLSGFRFQPTLQPIVSATATNPAWFLEVFGFAGFAKKCDIEVTRGCETHKLYSYKIACRLDRLIDLSKWDGSSLFTIWPYPGLIIATREAAEFIRRSRISGLTLVPINQYMLRGAGPGNASEKLNSVNFERLKDDTDFQYVISKRFVTGNISTCTV